jgi:hypothetical protein
MFLVSFPSSRGDPCYLVTPSRVGQRWDAKYPWARATHNATAFPTREGAQAALDEMKRVHAYIAPEINGGLFKRLCEARLIGKEEVEGIEIETL